MLESTNIVIKMSNTGENFMPAVSKHAVDIITTNASINEEDDPLSKDSFV